MRIDGCCTIYIYMKRYVIKYIYLIFIQRFRLVATKLHHILLYDEKSSYNHVSYCTRLPIFDTPSVYGENTCLENLLTGKM